MRQKAYHETGVYKYLEALGVLNESPEVIACAKREYWNQVKREWKKARNAQEKGFTVSFTPSELREISEAAKMHGMSRTRFIKNACLSYVHKRYLVPNMQSIQEIKTLLSLNFSLLQELYELEKAPVEVGLEVLHRMEQLEKQVLQQLVHPKLSGNVH